MTARPSGLFGRPTEVQQFLHQKPYPTAVDGHRFIVKVAAFFVDEVACPPASR